MDHLQRLLAVRKPGLMTEQPFHQTAVLLPLREGANGPEVLFEVRAHTLRRQAGEICFPGGHREPQDPSMSVTALRETSEELGIPQQSISLLGALDWLVASPTLVVYPFVGQLSPDAALRPNLDEVSEVFSVPLETFRRMTPRVYEVPFIPAPPDEFPFDAIPNGRNYAWRGWTRKVYFYEVDGRVIWGMTARILTHFLDMLS